jgi:acyl carrier protein
VNSIDDFVILLRDELGLPVTAGDMTLGLDDVAGWDSVQLLSLLPLLERRTGRTLPFADLLQARNLEDIYSLAVAA